jgi:hypothetical protein
VDPKDVLFKATPTRATPGLIGSDSNRSEEASRPKSLSDLEEDLDDLLEIRGEGATACRGGPVFDYDPDSNEEYPSTTSWSRGGVKGKGATAGREAPVLNNHLQPNDYFESFLGKHSGLTITSTP